MDSVNSKFQFRKYSNQNFKLNFKIKGLLERRNKHIAEKAQAVTSETSTASQDEPVEQTTEISTLFSDNNETNDLKVIEEVDQANKLDQTSFSDDLIEVKVNTGFSSSIFSNKCQETEAEGLQFTLKLKQNKNVLKFTLK